MKYESKIDEGPAKTPIQAVRAKPPIFSATGFAITWVKAQRKPPDNNKKTPNNLSCKSGLPVKKIIPIEAINKPNRFFKEGFSFKIKKAMRIPNGISHCISNVAEAASTMFKPEKVNEYWRVEPNKEIINNDLNNFFGNGKNQHIIIPLKDQRNPLSKIGGNWSIAGFAMTKPKPKIIGTSIARKISLIGSYYNCE